MNQLQTLTLSPRASAPEWSLNLIVVYSSIFKPGPEAAVVQTEEPPCGGEIQPPHLSITSLPPGPGWVCPGEDMGDINSISNPPLP